MEGGIKEEEYILPATLAIKLLIDWYRPITDAFRLNVSRWVENGMDIEDFPVSDQETIKYLLDEAWKGSTTLEHPLKRKKRLKELGYVSKARSYEEIYSSMMDRLPKKDRKPFEE